MRMLRVVMIGVSMCEQASCASMRCGIVWQCMARVVELYDSVYQRMTWYETHDSSDLVSTDLILD